jgi:hypothetical protein
MTGWLSGTQGIRKGAAVSGGRTEKIPNAAKDNSDGGTRRRDTLGEATSYLGRDKAQRTQNEADHFCAVCAFCGHSVDRAGLFLIS